MNRFQLNSDLYENIRNSSNWVQFNNNIIINNIINDSSDSELESLDSDDDDTTTNINIDQMISDNINLINIEHIRRPLNTNNSQIILNILNQIQNMNSNSNNNNNYNNITTLLA